jgi:hypothetical protein
MQSIFRRRVFALALAAIVAPVRSDADRPPDAGVEVERATEPGHEETPVEAPRVPTRRESQPRSPRAVVTRGLHRSVQVNVDSLQSNIVGDAANEPSMAIDPTDPDVIVIGWRQFDTVTSDFRQAGYAYSSDGGETWTFPGVLQPGQFRSDPVLAADSSGDFFYYSLSSTTTAEYFVSTDGGVSWTGPIAAPGGDKNWQVIDAEGAANDFIYAIWNSQFTCCAPGTDFTRSTNAAASFGGPYALPQHPKWGTLDVGPDGRLYVVGATLNQSSHLVLRSDNASNGFQIPTFPLAAQFNLGGVTTSGAPPNPGGLAGQVWIAVDRSAGPTSGYVYALGSVDPPGADPLDVHIVRSTNLGQSWSAPVAVNDNAGGGSYEWFGTLSVSPEGRIDVVWNDTRSGPATTSEVYYAYSTDAGVSFSAGLPVSPAYDSTVGWPVQNKMGDYYHMISASTHASLAYAATFNGEQDVYFLRVGDCNANGAHDSVDLAASASADVNANGIPDECEPDCNGNGVPDPVDLAGGTSADCNANAIPDECDVSSGASEDCDGDGVIDDCQVSFDLEPGSQGFTAGAAGDDATTGVWVRVDPVGTEAQPENDHTPSPGTMCFVTGQGTPGGTVGDNDVDGGRTTLLSPVLDLSAAGDPHVGYWRWYSNTAGSSPNADVFTVDVSGNGGLSWVNVETVGPAGPATSGGWSFHEFRVADLVPPTASVRLRFVASDLGAGSIVEAAIDDLVVLDCASCTAPVPGEVDDLLLGRSSPAVADLSWDAEPGADTYNVYRGAQHDASDLACYLSGLGSTAVSDDGALPPAGEALFYVVTAATCAGESPLGSGREAEPCP